MRNLMLSAFGLAMAFGAFCAPSLSKPLISPSDSIQGPLACILQQAQDHDLCVTEVLDQIASASKPN